MMAYFYTIAAIAAFSAQTTFEHSNYTVSYSIVSGLCFYVLAEMCVCVCVSFTVESEIEQIDFIDSCTGEEEEQEGRSRMSDAISLSSQFMAYIERRITREVCVCVWGRYRYTENTGGTM